MLHRSRYFRVSLTSRCNLSCFFCHREGNRRKIEVELSACEIIRACHTALEMGYTKVKLTGGEPTLREDIFDIISKLSKLKIPDLSIITNGTMLSTCAQELWNSGLRRMNVTIPTMDADRFYRIQGKQASILYEIINGIYRAKSVGFQNIKLNYVYVDEGSDKDLQEVMSFAGDVDATLVLLPVMNTDRYYPLQELYEKMLTIGVKKEEEVSDREGLRRRLLYMKNGAKILLRVDELSECVPYRFCEQCGCRNNCREGIFPIRLTSNGILVPCMESEQGRLDIRYLLRDNDVKRLRTAFLAIERCYQNA